eukprot:1133671-Pelagomonas_calceolata.AAC.22
MRLGCRGGCRTSFRTCKPVIDAWQDVRDRASALLLLSRSSAVIKSSVATNTQRYAESNKQDATMGCYPEGGHRCVELLEAISQKRMGV